MWLDLPAAAPDCPIKIRMRERGERWKKKKEERRMKKKKKKEEEEKLDRRGACCELDVLTVAPVWLQVAAEAPDMAEPAPVAPSVRPLCPNRNKIK